MNDGQWARCNFDGRPVHPDDQAITGRFEEWLALPKEERYGPEWHEFLGITPGETPGHASSHDAPEEELVSEAEDQERAIYVLAHLEWGRLYDVTAEQAVKADHADEAAWALAEAMECRRLTAEAEAPGNHQAGTET